jgi:RNA polymerase sigma-70 factor, ECF subfamily
MQTGKNLSDEKLVPKVLKNQELFAEIVQRYQAKLLRYALRLSADQDKAEDIVQKAFIKTFTHLNSFDTNKKFSSWIYRITHNEAVNLLKAENKFKSSDFTDWLIENLPSKENLEANLDQQLIKTNLDKNLKKLTLKYRSVLTLFYLEEKKYEEISDILKIPVNTVGVRLNRAKKLLKQTYEN